MTRLRLSAVANLIAIQLTVAGCGAPSKPASVVASTELEADLRGGISIYNASTVLTIPNPLNRGIKVLRNGERTLQGIVAPLLVTRQVRAAHENFATTLRFYDETFGLDSYDGNGAEVRAAVEAQRFHLVPILGLKANAAWMQPFGMFVFGAGGSDLGGFAESLDVVGHEFTHAVISSTSNLQYVGQSGAINEHLADVFGEMIQHFSAPESRPFLIGETTLRGDNATRAEALRDMLQPNRGLVEQPGHVDEISAQLGPSCQPSSSNDNCGVHILSGIPNRAAAMIIQKLGWTTSYPLFYAVMTQRLHSTSDFQHYRSEMLAECAATLAETQCDEVALAFDTVGI